MGLPAVIRNVFKRNGKIDLKQKVLKNREAVMDIMSSKIQGARQCPFLLGEKCIGEYCEHFLKFKAVDSEGKETEYSQCSHVKTPLLIIEMNRNIRTLTEEVRRMNNATTAKGSPDTG